MVIHATLKGKIFALNKINGEVVWKYQNSKPIESDLALHDNILIACSRDGLTTALNVDDGGALWRQELPDHIYTSPLIANDCIFIPDMKGNVFKLDLNKGTVLEKNSFNSPFYQPLSTDGNQLFIMGSDGKLWGLDFNLRPLWSVSLKGAPATQILITKNHLLITTYQKKIYLIDKQNHEIVQEFTLKHRPAAAVVDENGIVFIAMEYDSVLRLESSESGEKP